MKISLPTISLLIAMAIQGCSLTPEYGCPAPNGTTCMSASEVYSRDGNGEVIRPVNKGEDSSSSDSVEIVPPSAFTGPVAVSPGDPIFREPKRLRVWVVDWEDKNKVYHPNHYLYLQVDNGSWVLPVMRERLLGDGYGSE